MNQPEMMTVLSEVWNSSHSGHGNSWYNESCPRRSRLNAQYPEQPDYVFQVGLVFHKLMELWRSGQLHTVLLPENDDADTDSDGVAEALRLFKAYCSYYGDEHGRPKDFDCAGAEVALEDTEFFGVPFTMRADAVVAPTALCHSLRGLEIEAGLYLLDYKTTGAKSADQLIRDTLSTQFKSYIAIWNNQNPDRPVKGMIVDRVIRYKRDMMKPDPLTGRPKGLESTLIAAPSDTEIESIRRYYQWKSQYLQQDWCNLEACGYPKICRHWTSGACNRVSC
jgi:hypothetical protein